jgi:hypothetical protein
MSRDGGRLAGVSRAGCGYLERRTDNANPARRGRVEAVSGGIGSQTGDRDFPSVAAPKQTSMLGVPE